MPLSRPLLLLAPLLVVAACAEEARPTRGGTAPSSTAAPAGPVTRYDGRWGGTFTLVPLASQPCPPAPAGNLAMTINLGRGTVVLNPQTRQSLAGSVAADGSARFSDPIERVAALTGSFTDDRHFIGEYRSGRCTYSARFSRL